MYQSMNSIVLLRPPPSEIGFVFSLGECGPGRARSGGAEYIYISLYLELYLYPYLYINNEGLALCGTVFPVSAVVGAAVPAAVCRWGLFPCCPGVGRCLSGVYIP